MRAVVVPVGFEVGNVVRPLISLGLRNTDVVLAVYSKAKDEHTASRVRRAVEDARQFTSTLCRYEVLEVSGEDFVADVAMILERLRALDPEEYIFIICGGMRLLVFELVVAGNLLVTYNGKKVSFFVMREDGTYSILLGPQIVRLPILGRREVQALKIILEMGREVPRYLLVDRLASTFRSSLVFVYRLLGRLSGKGLIKVHGSTVSLTPEGLIVVAGVSESEAILVQGDSGDS